MQLSAPASLPLCVQHRHDPHGKRMKLRLFVLAVFATGSARAECFNFSATTFQLLRERSSSRAVRGEAIWSDAGKLGNGRVWGAVRGVVARPILELLKNLTAHTSTRNPRISKMKIIDIEDKNYLKHQKVRFEITPFPFISVRWTEEWVFELVRGQPTSPDIVVVSYEKTEGTSYIEHLCGNYVLEKEQFQKTDVYIYEEARATGRSEEDTLKDLSRTLESLRSTSMR